MSLTIATGFNEENLNAFKALRKHIYAKDLNGEHLLEKPIVLGSMFSQRGEAELFLIFNNNQPVAAAVTYSDPLAKEYIENAGFFNHFECIDSLKAFTKLEEAMLEWFNKKNCETIIGPMSSTINDTRGLLISGFEKPVFGMSYNPDYYQKLFTDSSWSKKVDLNEIEVNLPFDREKINKIATFAKSRFDNLVVRPLKLEELDNEIEIIVSFYNKTWQKNWGFIPLNTQEFSDAIAGIRNIMRPEYGTLVELDGECIAFSLILPDFNQLSQKHINRYRALFIGVDAKYRGIGIESLLIQSANDVKADKIHVGWVLENNFALKNVIKNLNGVEPVLKTYRLFQKNCLAGNNL